MSKEPTGNRDTASFRKRDREFTEEERLQVLRGIGRYLATKQKAPDFQSVYTFAKGHGFEGTYTESWQICQDLRDDFNAVEWDAAKKYETHGWRRKGVRLTAIGQRLAGVVLTDRCRWERTAEYVAAAAE